MKYLGVRVTFSNLKNIDWISWMQKWLTSWGLGFVIRLFSGARFTLLDACLRGIPSYYIAIIKQTLLKSWTSTKEDFSRLERRRKNLLYGEVEKGVQI
jgi:hypothetical protein